MKVNLCGPRKCLRDAFYARNTSPHAKKNATTYRFFGRWLLASCPYTRTGYRYGRENLLRKTMRKIKHIFLFALILLTTIISIKRQIDHLPNHSAALPTCHITHPLVQLLVLHGFTVFEWIVGSQLAARSMTA